jgi:hypothetical protein
MTSLGQKKMPTSCILPRTALLKLLMHFTSGTAIMGVIMDILISWKVIPNWPLTFVS